LLQHVKGNSDTIIVVTEPQLVEVFSSFEIIPMDDEFKQSTFVRSEEEASTLIDYVQTHTSAHQRELAWAGAFSKGLSASQVGPYSVMHDKAIYKYGYNSLEAQQLHWM
jgi:hypothetical protein